MNILHLIPGLNNASGPTQVVYHLAHEAAKAGHHVTVCYIQGRGAEPAYTFDPAVELLGFPAVGLRKWGYSPALRRFLRAELGRFDLVHVHSLWLYPNIAAMQAARRHGVPYIVRPAGSLEPWALGYSAWKKRLYLGLIERRILNKAAGIHAVSEQEAENIRKLGFKPPVIVVSNGIDAAAYPLEADKKTLRRELDLPEEAFVLLFLGRIHPVKNPSFLLQVFRKVHIDHPEALLLIAGPDDHPYARQIKIEAHTLDIEPFCRFIGEVRAEDRTRFYGAADVFLLPSFSENFAVAVLEALAAGLPVVVSQHTPWSEAEDVRAGFWLPLEESAFTSALHTLIENEPLRREMSANALVLAQRYDWESVAQKMMNEYVRLQN